MNKLAQCLHVFANLCLFKKMLNATVKRYCIYESYFLITYKITCGHFLFKIINKVHYCYVIIIQFWRFEKCKKSKINEQNII